VDVDVDSELMHPEEYMKKDTVVNMIMMLINSLISNTLRPYLKQFLFGSV